MRIPLNKFEQNINETILARGLSYYRNGHVQEPEILSQGKYEFVVVGTEDYIVQISLGNDTITDFVCNCPYDMGTVCKHVALSSYLLLVISRAEPSGYI